MMLNHEAVIPYLKFSLPDAARILDRIFRAHRNDMMRSKPTNL